MIDLSLLLLAQTFSDAQTSQASDSAPAMMMAELDDEEDAKPKQVRKKPKPKPKPAAATPATPATPLPYVSVADKPPPPVIVPAPAPVGAAPLPPVAAHASPSSTVPAAPERLPDPPPLPERIYIYPKVNPSGPREISLRCDTLVFAPDGKSTRGIVRLSLIPSLVNPDEFADIHVMAVDIGHGSIIRDTACEAYRCSVAVTPTFYSLTVVDKRKSEIKITLNRQTGAFYGYEKQAQTVASGLISLKKGVVTNENGWCVPEAAGKTLF